MGIAPPADPGSIAIAAILAYLLTRWWRGWKGAALSRTMSVIAVFSVSIAVVAGILIYIIPGGKSRTATCHAYARIYRARPGADRPDRRKQTRLAELPIFQRPDSTVASAPFSGYLATPSMRHCLAAKNFRHRGGRR